MVEKGFQIDKLCVDAGVTLVKPPFLRNKQRMSQEDALLNLDIGRALKRFKIFKILQQRVLKHLFPLFDDVVKLVECIVNLLPSVFAEEEFF